MRPARQNIHSVLPYLISLVIICLLAAWLIHSNIRSGLHTAGLINLSLGFVLLTAYFSSQVTRALRLPLISGYILTGIAAGPYAGGLLSSEMVSQLQLTDNLALSFIALTAGGSLELASLRNRFASIGLSILLQVIFIFAIVFLSFQLIGRILPQLSHLTENQLMVLSIIIGVITIARSPSSAIAIIKECRSKGPFTETLLGVTIVIDVLILLLFTFALSVARTIVSPDAAFNVSVFTGLLTEIGLSILAGVFLGKLIAVFIERVGSDLLLFLLFIAFGVTKLSVWLSGCMEFLFDITLHLEPLLICMSAGFFVQNFSRSGRIFIEHLDQMALPIFVLFFSIAGSALNLNSLAACWPIALGLVFIRILGIFIGTYLAGKLAKDPPLLFRNSWMGYLTQAGVAIGLAQLAGRQFPGISDFMTTIVLAVITLNQLIGPILFKIALDRVGESCIR